LVQNDPFALAGGHDHGLFVGGGTPNGVSHFGLWLGSLPYFLAIFGKHKFIGTNS
jgi:hypothetical protein